MITVRLMGGLGNQMFQYACARRLSIAHAVPLRLDTTWFQAEDLMPHETYTLGAFTLCPELCLVTDVRRRRRSFGRLIVESGYGVDDRVRSAPDRVYLSGFWQNESYFADIAPRVRAELSLRRCPAEETARLADELCNGQSVSLHVRQSSYADALPAAYYVDAVVEMQRRVARPRFYVFADEPGWARRELKLPVDWTLVETLDHDQPWMDLFAMASCRYHIIANSSFSWWGAWLNSRPDKVVIAPRVWFFNDRRGDAEFTLPPAWIRV